MKLMDEFSLINTFFKNIPIPRPEVLLSIGDDAACVSVPSNSNLLISCDTLIAGVHFLESWDPYDIAYKGVMVNVSDIAAMGGTPCWILLALSLPSLNNNWLKRFALGLKQALKKYNIALIGGDTTKGPLSMTYTIHGLIPKGKAIKRSTAKPDDIIYVTGNLGAAALAISKDMTLLNKNNKQKVMKKLLRPRPRTDFALALQKFASAAIDISDGLIADLKHICDESNVGACIDTNKIPLHPIVIPLKKGLDFALYGGDDYELCFTVPVSKNKSFIKFIEKNNLDCNAIGSIKKETKLYSLDQQGNYKVLKNKGYNHFPEKN